MKTQHTVCQTLVLYNGIAVAVVAGCIAAMAGCAATTRSFDDVCQATRSESDIDRNAAFFVDKYAEIVDRLDSKNYGFFTAVLGRHGHLYAAVHLEPYLAKADGEKRVIVAALVALFSHGNHSGAMQILHDAPFLGNPEMTKIADLVQDMLNPGMRAITAINDAMECRVLPGDWAVMLNSSKRWAAIERRVAQGGGRPVQEASDEEFFFLRVATQLDLGNWFEFGNICARHGHLNAAVWLSPLTPYFRGDQRIVFASLVALLSHGNAPLAMAEVERATKMTKSPQVLMLAVSVQRTLEICRDGLAMEDCKRVGIATERWASMPLAERWNRIRRSVLSSGAELYHH